MLTYTIKTAKNESKKICPAACADPSIGMADALLEIMLQQNFIILQQEYRPYTTSMIRFCFPDLIRDGLHYGQQFRIFNADDPVADVFWPLFQYSGNADSKDPKWDKCLTEYDPGSIGSLQMIQPKPDMWQVLDALHSYERSQPYRRKVKLDFIGDVKEVKPVEISSEFSLFDRFKRYFSGSCKFIGI